MLNRNDILETIKSMPRQKKVAVLGFCVVLSLCALVILGIISVFAGGESAAPTTVLTEQTEVLL